MAEERVTLSPPPEAPNVPSDEEKKELELEKKLTSVQEEVSKGNTALAKVLGNPQVQAVLAAQERGEEIEIIPRGKEREELESENGIDADPISLDELTGTELASHITKTVLKEIDKLIKAQLGDVSTKVDRIGQFLQSKETRTIESQIDDMRKRYPDFKKFEPHMAELAKDSRGLSLEELYLVAKRRTGAPIEPERTESERPTVSSSRPGLDRSHERISGVGPRAAFTEKLGDVLDRITVDLS